MARLPVPGSDDGTWGSILNDFLTQSLNSDGSLKSATGSRTGGVRLSNDLGGSATDPTVVGLRGREVASTAPTNGQVLAWSSASSRWEPAAGGGGGATNLTYTASTRTVASDTGTDAVLTLVDGTNPGLMASADKTKLDAIESGATADQSDAEIKTAYENNANTNAFTDAEQTKLAGVEAGAKDDQNASEVPITDSGAYFTSSNVEGALQELGAASGGALAMNDLSDVDAASPADNEVIVYNTGTGNWESQEMVADDVDASGAAIGLGSADYDVQSYLDALAARQHMNIRSVNANYTLASDDGWMVIEVDSASPVTITIPAETSIDYPIGTHLEIFQVGTGTVTIAGQGGVVIRKISDTFDLIGQYATAALRKRAADEWVLGGELA